MKQKFKKAFMEVAHTFANLSHAKKLKVGAIVVKDERIISIGYNGTPTGWDNECEAPEWSEGDWEPDLTYRTKPEVIHAEANAITKLARSSESSEGATLFCTHTPCIECAKLIYQSGIKEVIVAKSYVAHVGSGLEFLEKSGVTVEILLDN